MFHHERKRSLSMQRKPIKDLTRIVTANQFLSEEKRQVLLTKIHEITSLERSRYDVLCLPLIENLVQYGQNLPETANSYYSQPGGLIDHALNRTEAALSLFQEFMIPEGAESLSEEQKLWQYALYSAAILQGVGKLSVDFRVNLFDVSGHLLKEWNPLLESMSHGGAYYSYEFQKEPEIEFRKRVNLLLAIKLMPAKGYSWIVSNSRVLAVWLALLNEDERSAGTLGAILIRAEALSIQRYLTELLLRNLGNLSGRHSRMGAFTGGVPESLIEKKEQAVGLEFLQWMIKSLDKGGIRINEAPLFMVPGGMLMCQELFQKFILEHPEYKNWQALQVQKAFLTLGLHQRNAQGTVINRFENIQNREMQSGIVFTKYATALPDTVNIMSKGNIESISAMDLINKAQYPSQFIQQQNSVVIPQLQKLNTAGEWQVVEPENNAPRPGARSSG